MGDGHVDSRWKWKMERGKWSNELKSWFHFIFNSTYFYLNADCKRFFAFFLYFFFFAFRHARWNFCNYRRDGGVAKERRVEEAGGGGRDTAWRSTAAIAFSIFLPTPQRGRPPALQRRYLLLSITASLFLSLALSLILFRCNGSIIFYCCLCRRLSRFLCSTSINF